MGEKGKCKGAIYGKTIVVFNSLFISNLAIFAVLKILTMCFTMSGIFGWLMVAPHCTPSPKKIQKIKYQNTENFSLCTWSVMLYFKECCLVLETVLLNGIYLKNGK